MSDTGILVVNKCRNDSGKYIIHMRPRGEENRSKSEIGQGVVRRVSNRTVLTSQ